MNAKIQDIIQKMQKGERLYKYTGRLPALIIFETSEEKVPARVFNKMFEKALITVDNTKACETWYTLTDISKAFKF